MLISEQMILMDANISSKEEIIKTGAKLLNDAGHLNDEKSYIQAVKDRENEVSTNMGDRIAMPHARTDAVKEAGLIFIRLANPVQWDENGEVSLIFQIAVPESGGNLHLQILAKLARKLIYDDFKEKLFSIKNKDELLKLINETTGGIC